MPVVLEAASGPIELIPYGEAAELLDVRPATIWTYVHRGVLHPIRIADTAEYPAATPFLLRDEVAWYDRRRRVNTAAAGPSPYAERYAELLDAGAALAPLLADRRADMLARIRAEAPVHVHTGPVTTEAAPGMPAPGVPLAGIEGLGGAAWIVMLFALGAVLFALVRGLRPDASEIAQLRAAPGSSRLSEALRTVAALMDNRAA